MSLVTCSWRGGRGDGGSLGPDCDFGSEEEARVGAGFDSGRGGRDLDGEERNPVGPTLRWFQGMIYLLE